VETSLPGARLAKREPDHRKSNEGSAIMKGKMKILGAISAVAVLASVALAFQSSASPADDNLIAARLPGRWVLDATITDRLEAPRGFQPPRGFEFTKDDMVLKKLLPVYPRFASETIYLAGTAHVGADKHLFVLTNDKGNNHLVLFTVTSDGPVGQPHYYNISMACARDTMKDLLFIGGDVPRESAAAYSRFLK